MFTQHLSVPYFSFSSSNIHPKSVLPPLTSGEICQFGFGCSSVLGAQRVPGSLCQLSEHQRRFVGHVAQHPFGSAGEQHGPQRGTMVEMQLISSVSRKCGSTLMYYQPNAGRWHCCWCILDPLCARLSLSLSVSLAFVLVFVSRLHLSCRTCWWCPCLPTQRRQRTPTGRSAALPASLKRINRPWTVYSLPLSFSFSLFLSPLHPSLPFITLPFRWALQGSDQGCC